MTSLQKRLDRCLGNDDYYGAEQAWRMLHHRLTQKKNASQDDKNAALKHLFDGAKTLLGKGEAQAGSALGLLAVKHCVDYKVPVSQQSVESMLLVASAFVLDPASPTVDEARRECLRFLKSALSWSARQDCAGWQNGHSVLNAKAAEAAADLGDFPLAQKLFIRSNAPLTFAAFLHAWATESALPSERALLLTRAVLMYLVSENVGDANILRAEFARLSHWSVSAISAQRTREANAPPPLGNFCELLLRICRLEAAAAPVFAKIRTAYQAELRRDPEFDSMLTTIGTKYFNITPPQAGGLGGMMNSMLRGMMGNA